MAAGPGLLLTSKSGWPFYGETTNAGRAN